MAVKQSRRELLAGLVTAVGTGTGLILPGVRITLNSFDSAPRDLPTGRAVVFIRSLSHVLVRMEVLTRQD